MLNLDFFDEEIIPISEDYQTIGRLFGGNEKRTLVILPISQYEIESYKVLLEKILASVEVSVDKDVRIFALSAKTPFRVIHLADKEKCNVVIVFGDFLTQMGIHRIVPKYEIEKVGSIELVVSDSFHDLELDPSKKLKLALWKKLKELYGKK